MQVLFRRAVTLAWWDDLWLNEGFASYIEYKGVNYIQEDWDMVGGLHSVREEQGYTSDGKE